MMMTTTTMMTVTRCWMKKKISKKKGKRLTIYIPKIPPKSRAFIKEKDVIIAS